MANRLEFSTAIDSGGYARGIRDMEILSAGAGKRMTGALSGTTAGSIAGGGVRSGAIYETVALFRELGRGNYSRIPGSITILAQRMGLLRYMVKDTALASELYAAALSKEAALAEASAYLMTRKAAVEMLVFEASNFATASQIAEYETLQAESAAATVNAAALSKDAAAATADAAAQRTLAGTQATIISGFGLIAAGVLAVTLVAFEGYKIWKLYVDKLNEASKLGDKPFHADYVLKKDRSENYAAGLQKDINKEIEKSVELYNSAAKAADRISEVTKERFDHLRKMNEFSGKSDTEKLRAQTQIDAAERAAEIENKQAEQESLAQEGIAKQKAALAIKSTTKPDDENKLKSLKQHADEAQKFLDGLKALHGSWGDWYLRSYDLIGSATSERGRAEAQAVETAKQNISSYHGGLEAMDTNEGTRKQREELAKDAAQSLAKAATINQELPDLIKSYSQKNSDQVSEAAAKITKGGTTSSGIGKSSDSLTRVGNFLGSARGQIETLALEANKIAREHVAVSRKIEQNTRPRAKPPGVSHYPIH